MHLVHFIQVLLVNLLFYVLIDMDMILSYDIMLVKVFGNDLNDQLSILNQVKLILKKYEFDMFIHYVQILYD